jgi:hypothetical protein
LYIALKTGTEIPAAAVVTEEGGGTPPSSEPTTVPTADDYNNAMNELQTAIRTHGAASAQAQEAKKKADEILAKSYAEHDIVYTPTDLPKR